MLIFIWGIFAYFAPNVFLKPEIYLSFLPNIAIVLILSLGLLPLIIIKEFDMSFPSILALGGFLFSYTLNKSSSLSLALIISLLFGAVAGLVNGILVTKIKIPSIIATIGTSFFYRGLATIFCGGLGISLIESKGVLNFILSGNIFNISNQFIISLILAFLIYLVIFKMPFGDAILFLGDNKKAAIMLGFDEVKTKIILFVTSGVMSAFAGVLLSLEFLNYTPTQGDGYMLLVFASIFIGGTSANGGSGSVYGTIIGCIIMSILESGIVSIGFDSFYTRSIQGLIVIVSVSIYSLLNKRA